MQQFENAAACPGRGSQSFDPRRSLARGSLAPERAALHEHHDQWPSRPRRLRHIAARLDLGDGAAGIVRIRNARRHPSHRGRQLRTNAGDRSGEIGQFVRRVDVLGEDGGVDVRERDELQFEEHSSNLDDAVILGADFELESDSADAIIKRMRKAWIMRKADQPYSFQAAARLFQNPKGFSAAALIEQAGLARQRVGAAELSERNANYVVAHPGTTSRDVLRLVDLVRSKVREKTGVELRQELVLW